jgi:predicted TIM-barrel fold metal-dependent hydrolase
MSKRKGVGDIHTHQMNKYAVPNNLSKQQAGGFSEGFISSFIGKFFGRIVYGRRFKQFVKILTSKTIAEVADIQIMEMDEAGIDFAGVLAMDFSEIDPKYKGYNIPYSQQLFAIIENSARYPFRFFPLFFYEPRRSNIKCLLELAYKDYGIVGVKYYPAFGFDPRPDKDDFLESRENRTSIRENLEFLYQFAEEKSLPILTHCSAGGSFQCTIKRKEKYKKIWQFTEPSNFLNIAQHKKLRICFAHMGGSIYNKSTRGLATQWRNQIFNLITSGQADGLQSQSKFFTDHANVLCHSRKKKDRMTEHMSMVENLLHLPNTRDYIIFGSDWPLGRHVYSQKEYVDHYKNWLDPQKQERYFSDNIARFLFGESKQIRDNYIDFLKKHHGGNLPELPDWVEEKNGKYYLV